jgi:polyisoprenoid-binding protein YceI
MYSQRRARLATLVVLTVCAASRAHAADTYRIASGEIAVVCPLTVGGSFEARTKNLSGELGPASEQPGTVRGALRVDLQTLETGIGIRDRHMKDNYLEVDKGPDFSAAMFDDIRVEKLDGKSVFSGTLMLHGQRKPISGTADLQQRDGRVRVQAQFPLRISDFEIPTPKYLGVGVRDEIQIKVNLTAVPVAATAAGVQDR